MSLVGRIWRRVIGGTLSAEEKDLINTLRESGVQSFEVSDRGVVMTDPEEVRASARYEQLCQQAREVFDVTDPSSETNPRYQAYLRATDGQGRGRHDFIGFIAALKSAYPGTRYTAGMGSNHGVIIDQSAFTAFIDEAVEDDQVQRVSGRWVVMT